MASEKHRHKEVRKYYQSWLLSSSGFDSGPVSEKVRYHADGSQLRTSRDNSLIAFAQLGCLRLNVKRGVVTLISTDTQYILAEATRTLSLASGTATELAGDEIWFGNASLPRAQGVSPAALDPDEYLATDSDGSTFRAPALVIKDISQHPRYASRGYAGSGVNFYCGVPVVTASGIPIGVYTLTDDKPRHGLTATELRFMCDMATVVMRHLERVKNEAAKYRGETMILGLGRFASGASTLHDEGTVSAPTTDTHDFDQGASDNAAMPTFKGLTITAANPAKLRPVLATIERSPTSLKRPALSSGDSSHPSKRVDVSHKSSSIGFETIASHGSPPSRRSSSVLEPRKSFAESTDLVFARAANILRECAVADGVLFFDASSAKPSELSRSRSTSPGLLQENLSEALPTAATHVEESTIGSLSSDESDINTTAKTRKKTCRLLGYSIDSTALSSTSTGSTEGLWISERSIARLIRLYPKGKLFQFFPDGGMSSSEGDHSATDTTSVVKTVRLPNVARNPAKTTDFYGTDGDTAVHIASTGKLQRTSKAIAAELLRMAPGSRSIMWLPMWDFVKQRWSAGCFLWSRRPEALVTVQDDLAYLKTFANSIMMEVAMMDTHIADLAKSTFVANISHELRSPLHGILGNLEILKDTSVDHFQNSLIASMEVCGKTLAETIDHVLDYAKINHLSKQSQRDSHTRSPRRQETNPSIDQRRQMGNIESTFDLAEIVEEVSETVCASYAFKPRDLPSSNHATSSPSIVGTDAVQSSMPARDVTIILDIDHRADWSVCSEPGAVRRILANLLGNSLKYTQSGMIRVSLSGSGRTNSRGATSSLDSVISVIDTGRGMSQEFARNYAFTPFTQESSFSAGTGLGLSIVQQLVNSLGGTIQLESEEGVGTSVKVFLDLARGTSVAAASAHATAVISSEVIPKLSNRSISIIDPHTESPGPSGPSIEALHLSLEKMIQSWSEMEVVDVKNLSSRPTDLVLYTSCPSAEHLQSSRLLPKGNRSPPTIIIVSNALEKAAIFQQSAIVKCLGSRFDIITYPVGPQKLFKSVQHLLNLKSDENESYSIPIPLVSVDESASQPSEGSRPYSQKHGASEGHMSTFTTAKMPIEPPIKPEQALGDVQEGQPDRNSEAMQSPDPQRTDHQVKEGLIPRTKILSQRTYSAPEIRSMQQMDDQDGFHVLLVDDNDINLNILKACMKRAKLSFEAAKDGLEALQVFRAGIDSAQSFSHVLMDISMPIMDGIEATRRIRDVEQTYRKHRRRSSAHHKKVVSSGSSEPPPPADASLQATKSIGKGQLEAKAVGNKAGDDTKDRAMVIALSGVASEQTQREMFEAGADMFLSKPINMKRLIEMIKSCHL